MTSSASTPAAASSPTAQIESQAAAAPSPVNASAVAGPEQSALKDVCVAEEQNAGQEVVISRPVAQTQEIAVEPGKTYVFGFDKDTAESYVLENGNLTISFDCGGKIILKDYAGAIAAANPALFAFSDVISQDQLAGLVKVVDAQDILVEDPQAGLRKEVATTDTSAPPSDEQLETAVLIEEKVEKIEPAAGEEAQTAEQVAEIEPAAGDTGGAAGRAGGYGFNSSFSATPVGPLAAVGPIGATALAYGAEFPEPGVFLDREGNDNDPFAGQSQNAVDETDFPGPVAVSGQVVVDFGADGPGTIAGNGTFAAGGSLAGGTLTSHGVPVAVAQTGSGYAGTAGGIPVFTLTINPATGDYTFTLLQPIDHADGTDPNDAIGLTFGVVARDSDGDAVNTSVVINVFDDAPPAVAPVSHTIDEDALSRGPVSVNGALAIDFGADGAGSVQPNGTTNVRGDIAGGVLTAGGVPVTITQTATGYEGKAGGVLVFTLDVNATGAYNFTLHQALDHSDPGDIITLDFGVIVRDYDGDSTSSAITINIEDDKPQISDNPAIGSGMENVDETNLGPVIVGGQLVIDTGADTPATVSTTGGFTSSVALSSGGTPVAITSTPTGYAGTANGVTIFTLDVTATGAYTFTLHGVLDHPNALNPNDIITLQFGVQIADADGDSDTGTITVNVFDDGPVAHDDFNTLDDATNSATGNVITGLNGGPGAADDLSEDADNTVTQISFNGTTVNVPASGTATINGDYGTLKIAADGSYTYTQFSAGSGAGAKHFVSQGEAFPDMDEAVAIDATERQALGVAPGNLDVNAGEQISVTLVSEGAAYNNTVGAFTVGTDGAIHFSQLLIVNSNTAPTGPVYGTTAGSDSQFGLFMIADGYTENGGYAGLDFNTGSLEFVYDYGLPTERIANISDDGARVNLVYTSAGGVETVLNGPIYYTTERGSTDNLNADDSVRVVSAIAPGGDDTVLRIGFEDKPGLGDEDYNDLVFDLKIQPPAAVCGTDVFTYTLTDGDGDTSKATLTLQCDDDKPIIVGLENVTVDEGNLSPTTSVSDSIQADFGSEGPGTIAGNGNFTGGPFTSNGQPVLVTFNAATNTYTGTASGNQVFTLAIQTNGNYTFTLLDTLDHPDASNPNDSLSMQFGVKATDADGDTATGTITVNVLDDGPVAVNDGNFTNALTSVSGNVLSNDTIGADTPGAVSAITFNGATTAIAPGGSVVVNGAYGVLTIGSNGNYSYMANGGADGADQFTYTMHDYDGDTSQAKLTINVDVDDRPIIVSPAREVVDETNLGPITETGTISATYGVDGPGAITPDGGFSSSGSKLGGNLTSNGVPVTVTATADGYVGRAGGATVFTLAINPATGAYTFTLLATLDHADGSNPNDVISLNFGVVATDADGDTASTTLRVDVRDDAPVAHNDVNVFDHNLSMTATGNVITGLNGGAGAADNLSNDTPNTLTKIAFDGTIVNVPATGTATIKGDYGSLKIAADGSYTYSKFTSGPDAKHFVSQGEVFPDMDEACHRRIAG